MAVQEGAGDTLINHFLSISRKQLLLSPDCRSPSSISNSIPMSSQFADQVGLSSLKSSFKFAAKLRVGTCILLASPKVADFYTTESRHRFLQ